ncbi:uncharacterized protein LOC133929113 isoform X2 [Phragmites australis]|uniref:uncharacterized protein LOC133929113 isoform X2 n=1 Tax=Phragmites australis TaxID=29695 RepID=UPI002D76C178|nr:uncharacterized protein LOC133929113 isoform X2 [Phragmites australis]
MDVFLQRLKRLDAYPKVNEDFYKRTLSGGVVTLVAAVIMLLLFISETRAYFFSATETKLVVDTSRGERLRVNFDITFPSIPCTLLSVDTTDISGEQHHDIRHDIEKRRLDSHGNVIEARKEGIGGAKIERPLQKHGGRLDKGEQYCGTCYGAEESDDQCCNSCEEVREAYKKKGWALTNPDLIDQITHKINKLSFGTEFPGVINPLDGAQWTQPASDGTYQYFVKVVPTIYTDIRGNKIHSNQFSVTEHFRDGNVRLKPQPGVFFFYDFSPIKVIFTEENRSLLHYLTNLCAIVGGVFTVSGIIDSFIFHGQKALKKKMELGKYR